MMGVEPSIDQNIFPRVVDQLLWCPWEQSHPCETSSIDEAMDGNVASLEQMEAHLDVVIEMASYDTFETLVQQGV